MNFTPSWITSQSFAWRSCAENDRVLLEIDAGAMEAISQHPWRGNVRELENCMERTVILCEGEVLTVEELRLDGDIGEEGGMESLDNISLTLRQMEKELILRRLNRTGGNRTRAAEMLGISVRTLRNKINQYRTEGVAIPG